MRLEDFLRPWLTALLALAPPFAYSYPDVNHIIQCSVEANQADWEAQPKYDYRERDQTSQGTKTYDVAMILGSPYRRLVEIDEKGLSSDDRQRELEKLNNTVAERETESPEEGARRIAKYKKDRERDHLLIQQLTKAFDFKLLGKQRMDGHDVYVLRATPRPDYMPPNVDSEVLKGMRGRLWIDTKTFQWVKVDAEVIRPVTIKGFLARVEPGTRFELEKEPVSAGIWFPKHFRMRSSSKLFFLFTHKTQADQTYFRYRKQTSDIEDKFKTGDCSSAGSEPQLSERFSDFPQGPWKPIETARPNFSLKR